MKGVIKLISNLKITGLFGRFNYNIELKDNNITILTGPNGFGKSTILKIILEISNLNLLYFFNLEFKEIIIQCTDSNTISLKKQKNKFLVNDEKIDNQNFKEYFFSQHRFTQIRPNKWLDRETRKFYNSMEDAYFTLFDDLSEEDSDLFTMFLNKQQNTSFLKIKKILLDFKTSCGNIRLISEQRLIKQNHAYTDNEEKIIDVISELPQKMKYKISKVSEDYSKKANSLDSSYPGRLFSTKEGLKDKKEYEEKMKIANSKFEKLNKYDLVDFKIIKANNYEEEFSKALKIYFEDFESKYAVFEDFIDRLDLYTEIVNSRLSFKEIKITRKEGLIVVSKDKNKSTCLDLNHLSSGEKQEIVLFYELIFETDKNLLLLIDEPEISLHILWQKKFMDDLMKVVNMGQLEVIVATHSPQIINNHWDMQIDLGELYGN